MMTGFELVILLWLVLAFPAGLLVGMWGSARAGSEGRARRLRRMRDRSQPEQTRP